MALSAVAQESGQEIIFSSPKTDGAQVVAPSLTPQNPQLSGLPSSLLAPVPAFPSRPSDALPPPPMNMSGQQRLKQLQEERRNWTLMTPAEIFGVTTTEKLLQPPERDAFGREKKTTQLERYLARESQARAGVTNGWRSDRANSPWNSSRDDDASPFAHWRDGTADTAQNLNRFLDSQQNRNSPANRNGPANQNGQIVSSAFDEFARKKEDLEKLEKTASMERFRQMLNPSYASEQPSPNSRYFPVSKPVVDPNLTQPEYVPNPAGASFKPLTSDIGRPVGLTPLPGVVTPRLQPVITPSWKPQPPPWLSQSPQPTAFPQLRY
jgi:hypothetical protein